MADDPRKPHASEPTEPDDDGLYELAEDPDLAEPAPPPPPIGLGPDPASASALAEDPESALEPDTGPTMKTGEGGKGAASHFSGEDPEYVNPEIARMRREEARIKAAEEEAAADAKKKTVLVAVGVVVVVLVVIGYVLFRL